MNNTKMAILITLFTCTSQGKKHYSLISINKIIALLKKLHKTQVKRRWVFQCIRDMINAGLLSRKARYLHKSDGTINQLSSITAITLKGAKLLVSKRVSGAFLLLKNIMAWIKNQDKRFPNKEDYTKQRNTEMDEQERRALEKLAENALKPV